MVVVELVTWRAYIYPTNYNIVIDHTYIHVHSLPDIPSVAARTLDPSNIYLYHIPIHVRGALTVDVETTCSYKLNARDYRQARVRPYVSLAGIHSTPQILTPPECAGLPFAEKH